MQSGRNTKPAGKPAPRAVPAVTRSVAILRYLAQSDEPVGVNAIARALDIIPSTCLHILRALVAEELVAVDPDTKRYALDAGVLTLARGALRQDDFASGVQGHLDRLSAQFGVTAIGVRLIGLQHMIVVAISHSDMAFRIHVDVGSRFPALISATGRCLAAFGNHPEPELRRAFTRLRWDAAPDYGTWCDEVAETRRLGFGVDPGNYIRGITVISAPVIGPAGSMTHGVVAVGLADQMREAGHDTIGAAVAEVAALCTSRGGG